MSTDTLTREQRDSILALSRAPRPDRAQRVQALRRSSAADPHRPAPQRTRGGRQGARRTAIRESLGH